MNNYKLKFLSALPLMLFAIPFLGKAQLAPMGSMYFQNQYLNNPAFAGIDRGLDVNFGLRQQWGNVPGSPRMQIATLAYAMTEKAAIGLNLNNDQTGLFKRTRLMGSYAYHLPITNNGAKLNFGLSFGFMDELVDFSKYDGDMGDLTVNTFNQRGQYLDGDFGIAYTDSHLTLQATLTNLGNTLGFNKQVVEVVDEPKMFAAASYRFDFPNSWNASFEPKAAYRLIKGFENIFDIGGNLSFTDGKIGLITIYHSTKAISFGFSTNLSQTFALTGFYTSNTAALAGQTNGNFEINLKISLLGK